MKVEPGFLCRIVTVSLTHSLFLSLALSHFTHTPLTHVHIHIHTPTHTGSAETYWDLFSLRYKLGPPLNSVFTPGAQAQYARIAKLLWRLRRAERSLNDAWRQLKVCLWVCAHGLCLLRLLRVCWKGEIPHCFCQMERFLSVSNNSCLSSITPVACNTPTSQPPSPLPPTQPTHTCTPTCSPPPPTG